MPALNRSRTKKLSKSLVPKQRNRGDETERTKPDSD